MAVVETFLCRSREDDSIRSGLEEDNKGCCQRPSPPHSRAALLVLIPLHQRILKKNPANPLVEGSHRSNDPLTWHLCAPMCLCVCVCFFLDVSAPVGIFQGSGLRNWSEQAFHADAVVLVVLFRFKLYSFVFFVRSEQ